MPNWTPEEIEAAREYFKPAFIDQYNRCIELLEQAKDDDLNMDYKTIHKWLKSSQDYHRWAAMVLQVYKNGMPSQFCHFQVPEDEEVGWF
jgi:hypothetical protein